MRRRSIARTAVTASAISSVKTNKAVRNSLNQAPQPSAPVHVHQDSNEPLNLLKERLAKGEITLEEFNEIKKALV